MRVHTVNGLRAQNKQIKKYLDFPDLQLDHGQLLIPLSGTVSCVELARLIKHALQNVTATGW